MTTAKVSRHESFLILTEVLPSYPFVLLDLIDSYLRCNFIPDLAKVIRKLEAHQDWITALITLPSGSLLSACYDGTIRRWNVLDGTLENTYTLKGEVRSLCLGPRGTFYSGGQQEVRLWNSTDCVTTFPLEVSATTVCYALIPSPEGGDRRLICGGNNDFFASLDVETEKLTPLKKLQADVWGLCAAGEVGDNLFISATNDYKVRLWDSRKREPVEELMGHTSCVNVVRSLDAKTFVSGADDHRIRVWDLATRRCVRTLAGHNHHVRDLALTQGGELVSASSNPSNCLCVWSTKTWEKLQSFNGKGYISTCVNVDGSVSAGGEKQNPAIDIYGLF